MKNSGRNFSFVTAVMLSWCVLTAANAAEKSTAAESDRVMDMTPKNASEETLFYTLNETLEENRKIRISLKEIQQAYEKKTIENEDLKNELKKLEGLALERNRELLTQTRQLESRLKDTQKAAEMVKEEQEQFQEEKESILAKVDATEEENQKLKAVLADSILETEKQEILEAVEKNGEAAIIAQKRLSELNRENQEYKNNISAAYYEMGNVLFQIRQYEEAAENYRKVISMDPAHAWAHHNLAVIEDYYLNDSDSAYEHYQLYLNYKPIGEEAQEVRRRVLDLNLLQKMSTTSPLKSDFDRYHRETGNAKL